MSETIDITDPSDPINVTPFTEGEARQITEEIKSGFDSLGEKLLEAHRRRAWEPLGYLNFADYSQNEFGKSRYEANRLLIDARVTSSLRSKFRSEEIKELSVSQKELLVKIPAEQRAEALEEAQQLAQDEGRKKSTAQHVRRVVEQRLALPPKKKGYGLGKKPAPTKWHRSEWEGSRKFQLEEPFLWVEYSEEESGCQFDIYARQDGKLFDSIQLDLDEAQAWATPEVAAKYLAKDSLETRKNITVETRKSITLEAQLTSVLEEKEKLEAQVIERDQTITGLKLQISGTEAELIQMKVVLQSLQLPDHWIYCGATIQGPVEVAGTKKTTLLEIESGHQVILLPDQHSQTGLCYVRPVEGENWLDGIAVKWSDLKPFDSRDELISSLQAENAAFKAQLQQLKRELKFSEELAQKNFQERNEMWERFQAAHLKNQQIQAELDARCQQLALESSECSKELVSPPEKPLSRFSIGEIKTRSQLEQHSSRRQMDKAREEGYLILPDGSEWRQINREGNEHLWQSLGHRPVVVLFECIRSQGECVST